MDDDAATLVTIGAIVVAGLAANELGRRTRLPRVTLLLLVGILAGPEVFDLLPAESEEQWFPLVTNVALVMVGFLLGEDFTADKIRRYGRPVVIISLGVAVGSAAAVGVGLFATGLSATAALLLAAASIATAPAATLEVLRESEAEGEFARTLRGIVAVDDVWGIAIFSLALAVGGIIGGNSNPMELLGQGVWEIGGAILLGLVAGLTMARLTGRIEPGEPTLLEALGLVLLVAGPALWLGVSVLLAAVVLGGVVANIASHHTRPFHEIEGIEAPFLAIFFFLAGASLQLSALLDVGLLASAYVVLQATGRIGGAYLTARIINAPTSIRRWTGVERFPDLRDEVLTVVVGTSVIFEVVGPPLTRLALSRAGGTNRPQQDHVYPGE